MSDSPPKEESSEGMDGRSVMVLGTKFSHPYCQASHSGPGDVDILVAESFPRRLDLLTNEQIISKLLSFVEKEIEMRKKVVLESEESCLNLIEIKKLVTSLHEDHHIILRQSAPLALVHVHTQPEANFEITDSTTSNNTSDTSNSKPTFTELMEMSTIDEGTGQVIECSEEFNGGKVPTLSELLQMCSIKD